MLNYALSQDMSYLWYELSIYEYEFILIKYSSWITAGKDKNIQPDSPHWQNSCIAFE